MSNKNRNYTNYSKPNKPAEAVAPETPKEVTESPEVLETKAPEHQSEENTKNIQEITTIATPEPQAYQSEPEDPDAVIGVVVNCERLNIRAEAKSDAKIVGTFFKGQEIEIYLDTSTDEFYDVSVGFCMKKYIEINK